MKHKRKVFFTLLLLLAIVLCMTGCRKQEKEKYPELKIDPETFSTGFRSELGSVPVIFLRSGDNTANAVFATMLSGQLKRSELGTYEIKKDVLTVTFPESGEVLVFIAANEVTMMLVKEQSTWKYVKWMPEGVLFHCVGTVPSEEMPSEDVIV